MIKMNPVECERVGTYLESESERKLSGREKEPRWIWRKQDILLY
jgi:hypothetical protein